MCACVTQNKGVLNHADFYITVATIFFNTVGGNRCGLWAIH